MEPGGLGLSENVSRNRLALGVAMAVTSGTAESSEDVLYVPATSLCLRPSLHSAHGRSSLRLEARASLRLSGIVLNSKRINAITLARRGFEFSFFDDRFCNAMTVVPIPIEICALEIQQIF